MVILKKSFTIIYFSFIVYLFYSCTSDIIDEVNSSTNIETNLSQLNDYYEVDEVNTLNAFKDLNINSDTTFIKVSSILPKGHLFEATSHGFSSFEQGPVEKTMFNPEVANILGVEPYVIYLYRRIWVTSNVFFQGEEDFRVIDRPSPECGLRPSNQIFEIGYTSSLENRKFEMKTILYYIQTYVSGQKINKWAPRNISDLVWNYAYYTMP